MKSSIGAFVAALMLAIGLASSSGFAVANSEAAGQVGYDAQGNAGHIHTVVTGDTLWDISSAYLNTPWVWPSIWNENPAVANPHRIFPGDKIWISTNQIRRITDEEAEALLNGGPVVEVVEEEVTVEVEGVEEEIPAAPEEVAEEISDSPLFIMNFRESDKRGVVDSEAFDDRTLTLIESSSLRTLLGQGDEVYINVGEGDVEIGDRFNIVRSEGAIRDPETQKRLGYYVERLGWLEVIAVGPDTATARIKESRREISRGDRLVPRTEEPPEIGITLGTSGTSGQLAYVPDERDVSGGFDVVFLNRGSSNGVEVGNLVEVIRYGGQRWGAARDKKASLALPSEVVAHLIILDAKENTSMAYVAHAIDVVAVGDGFRMAERK
jgi:hypothetical protein